MSQVQQIALTRALALLKSINAQFKIITPEGEEHGELEVVIPKERRRTRGPYEYGALTRYVAPLLEKVQTADAVEIPFGEFDGERLRGAVSAYAVSLWGKGSAITAVNKERSVVELLRVS